MSDKLEDYFLEKYGSMTMGELYNKAVKINEVRGDGRNKNINFIELEFDNSDRIIIRRSNYNITK